MFLKTYLTSLFVILFSIGVGALAFTTYGFYMGSILEKEGNIVQENFKIMNTDAGIKLVTWYFTEFEKVALIKKYSVGTSLYIANICYNLPNKQDTVNRVNEKIAYNESCKEKQIPESEIRPEVEQVVREMDVFYKKYDEDSTNLGNHIFMDEDYAFKKDTTFLIINSIISFIALFFSTIIWFLARRKNTIPPSV